MKMKVEGIKMYLNIIAIFFVLGFIIKKIIFLKKPVYIYKEKLIESRPTEMLGVLMSAVGFVISVIEVFQYRTELSVKICIANAVVTIVLFIFTLIDYKKFKVGVYENGILYRSSFYKWGKIYTYKYKLVNEDLANIIFYIHNRNDENKLFKFKIVESKENAKNILDAIGNNIDPSRT
ncbi:hypothetical protein LJC13_03390 [Peptostreptococcaceae bacterium OttesenSCG-928-C18]|nr:hypothetical protein [Peptostreptococcaceae bacterium OttesenSCG-928-C18]